MRLPVNRGSNVDESQKAGAEEVQCERESIQDVRSARFSTLGI
jgi:hypothetical protein